MTEARELRQQHDNRGDLGRWIGLLLPPVVWSAQLEGLWLTSEYGCLDGNFNWNHVVSGAALVLSAVGGIVAWTYLPDGAYEPSKEQGTPTARRRFMGYLGVALAVEFCILIIAQWLPTLLGVPCHK